MFPNSRSPRSLLARVFTLGKGEAMARFAAIPGPTPVVGMGNASEFLGVTPFEGLARLQRRYGDLVAFWLFEQPNLLVNRPELIEEILVTRAPSFIKNNPRGATVVPIMGESLFTSRGGHDWARKRQLHPFSREGIVAFYDQALPKVVALTQERLEAADQGETVSLLTLLLGASFDAFSESILGVTLPEVYLQTFERLMTEVSRRGVVALSPSPGFWRARERWFRLIEARISALRAAPDLGATSLISHVFLKGWMDFGEDLLRDEVSTLFGAGTRNVGITACLLLYLLADHPQILEAVRAEGDAAHGGRPETLSWATLSALPILHRVYQETLRLYPVVPGFVRETHPDADVFLAGHLLPRSTQIFIVPWTLQRRADLWPDPLRFDPDRFLTPPDPLHYIPFGLGERACVGEDFTALCVKAMVLGALAHYDILPRESGPPRLDSMAATLFPADGIPCDLRRRA